MRHFEATGHRGNGHAVAQIAITEELAQALSVTLLAQLRRPGERAAAAAGHAKATSDLRTTPAHANGQASLQTEMDIAYQHVLGFPFDPRSHTQAALRRTALELVKQRIPASR